MARSPRDMLLRFIVSSLLLAKSATAQEVFNQGTRKDPELESAEFKVDVRDDPSDTVAELTRYNIVGNVLREDGQSVEHWFVLFCVEWYEPCQAHAAAYERLSAEVQAARGNGALLRAPVRFGKVSCARDKSLCNDFGVEEYPTVKHYASGKSLGLWVPERNQPNMQSWLNQQLTKATQTPAVPFVPAAGFSPRVVANFIAVALLFGLSFCHVLKELVSWRPKFMGARGAVWREVELSSTSTVPAPTAPPVEPLPAEGRNPQSRPRVIGTTSEDWSVAL